MADENEQAYVNGGNAAWLHILREALKHLGTEGFSKERLIAEREEAILVLRRLCGDHGDNEWDDDLHLADIIDKHLGRHLPSSD